MSLPIRVVATYTTIPSRYDVLYKSILSLHQQTYKLDAIYLGIPKRSQRLNVSYPPLPAKILSLCTVVNIETDYGPLTKICAGVLSETDPATVIISCDDDVTFPPNFIEIIMSHHKTHPTSVICGTGALLGKGLAFISMVSTVHPAQYWSAFTGFEVGPEGRAVDLIFGVAGVLYPRACFPTNDKIHNDLLQYSLLDRSIFHNDDVLISGYLSKNNIERRVFIDIPAIFIHAGADALSADVVKAITRMNTSINKVQEYGFFTSMEPVYIDETPAGRIFFIIIIITLLFLLCWFFYISL